MESGWVSQSGAFLVESHTCLFSLVSWTGSGEMLLSKTCGTIDPAL